VHYCGHGSSFSAAGCCHKVKEMIAKCEDVACQFEQVLLASLNECRLHVAASRAELNFHDHLDNVSVDLARLQA